MIQYFKLALACAALGALLGAAASFKAPARYESTATVGLTGGLTFDSQSAEAQAAVQARILAIKQEILSDSSVTELVHRPSLGLYPAERAQYPIERVLRIARRDLTIQPGETVPPSVRITFQYPEANVAQEVAREISRRFVERNSELEERRRLRDGLSGAIHLQILDAATAPREPLGADWILPAIGAGAGLALGLILARLRLRAFPLAVSALVGASIACAIGLLSPDGHALNGDLCDLAIAGALCGAAICTFLLRSRLAGANPYARFAIHGGVAAATLAALISLAIPNRYLSTALVRISWGGPVDPGSEISDRIKELTTQILSRGSLVEMVQRPSLDLYRAERTRRPLGDIVQEMRSGALRIVPHTGSGADRSTALLIAFEYPDAYKAQAVVREIVSRFMEQNATVEHLGGRITGDAYRVQMLVVDPPSLPEIPVGPNRPAAIAAAWIAGLLCGCLFAFAGGPRLTWRTALPHLKYALLAGGLGALIAATVSLAFPSRYVSTALIRVGLLNSSGQPDSRATQRLSDVMAQVLGDASLGDIVQRPSLDLYGDLRRRVPLDAVLREMRRRDLRIQPLDISSLDGRPTAFRISFEYAGREKAHAFVQSLVSRILETYVFHLDPTVAGIEVLDPADLPDTPHTPNRVNIAGLGLFAGMLLGLTFAMMRAGHRPHYDLS